MKSAASESFGLLFAAVRVATIARSTTARLRSYSTCNDGLIAFLFDLIVESSRAMVCRYERSPGRSFTGWIFGAEVVEVLFGRTVPTDLDGTLATMGAGAVFCTSTGIVTCGGLVLAGIVAATSGGADT